ncbi:enoyl-CoA hydratase/isomerase family protein [Syntrophomonas palmitatica]|uniref:enoyl-CoA hydratase/isomerase family protein n=1 Tax=Syntrophomonas palmitatica TaxID=402877 RepID=UPI0006D28AB8|nr:enoyl-CoA hydratase/isomerase family protein [Syntrophomonas palmitatica]
MSYGDWLLFKKEGSIGIITLNHPENYNLVNWQLLEELDEVQGVIEKDKDLRAIIINANGDHFSAGIDLHILVNDVDSRFIMDKLTWLQRVYSRWQEWAIPVIAAVHGLCYGSAMELILGCDIRIAAEDTRMAIPEVRFGLSPDMGGTTRLTHLIGPGQAKRMIIGCEEVDAQEALRMGMVEIVVPREQLMERALKMAKRIAGLPPAAVRFAKKGINLAAESSVAAGLLFEQAQSTFCCGTYDQNEAIKAFFEKRKPEFKGE